MTPAEHYARAEELAGAAEAYDLDGAPLTAQARRQAALVHATLATATQAHIPDAEILDAPAEQSVPVTADDSERWPEFHPRDRAEVLAALRALLALLETHPDLPTPDVAAWVCTQGTVADGAARAAIDRAAEILGSPACEKRGRHYQVGMNFAPGVEYRVYHVPRSTSLVEPEAAQDETPEWSA